MSSFESNCASSYGGDRRANVEVFELRNSGNQLVTRADFQDSNLAKDERGNVLAVRENSGKLLFTASYDDNDNVTNITYAGGHSIQKQTDGSYLMKYNSFLDKDSPCHQPAKDNHVTDVKVLADGKITWKADGVTILVDNVYKKLWQNGKLQEADNYSGSIQFDSPFNKNEPQQGFWQRMWHMQNPPNLEAAVLVMGLDGKTTTTVFKIPR